MPYLTERNHEGCPPSKPWAVVKESDDHLMGCHATEAQADAQIAALHAGETSAEGLTVRGLVGGHPVTIAWSEQGGFDDPSGLTALLIADGTLVCATTTGPCFPAAASPGYVALLTAVSAVDAVTEMIGAGTLIEQLQELSAVPEGATP